ncbi:MAG: ankyrin repeat domain-containing protein [Akkermansia sp.]|nr:ankyrin repeat domain-containing protein [Akkermansia sp.]
MKLYRFCLIFVVAFMMGMGASTSMGADVDRPVKKTVKKVKKVRKGKKKAQKSAQTNQKQLLARKQLLDKQVTREQYVSAMNSAVLANDVDMIRLLIDAGADVNALHKECTPLYTAILESKQETVKVLLTAPGIDVNKECVRGWTPLTMSAENFRPVAYLNLLLSAPGIDVNKSNGNGETALFCAVSAHQVDKVKALLDVPGIRIEQADNKGFTPLQVAERSRDNDVARLIREAMQKE